MLKILKNNTITNNIQDNSNELVTTEFSCKPSQVLMQTNTPIIVSMKSIVKKQPTNARIVEKESKFERLVIESPNHKKVSLSYKNCRPCLFRNRSPIKIEVSRLSLVS